MEQSSATWLCVQQVMGFWQQVPTCNSRMPTNRQVCWSSFWNLDRIMQSPTWSNHPTGQKRQATRYEVAPVARCCLGIAVAESGFWWCRWWSTTHKLHEQLWKMDIPTTLDMICHKSLQGLISPKQVSDKQHMDIWTPSFYLYSIPYPHHIPLYPFISLTPIIFNDFPFASDVTKKYPHPTSPSLSPVISHFSVPLDIPLTSHWMSKQQGSPTAERPKASTIRADTREVTLVEHKELLSTPRSWHRPLTSVRLSKNCPTLDFNKHTCAHTHIFFACICFSYMWFMFSIFNYINNKCILIKYIYTYMCGNHSLPPEIISTNL